MVDIRHPHLVELQEFFGEHYPWFFTMELIRGVNFLAWVECRESTNGEAGPACNIAFATDSTGVIPQPDANPM